ncbi:MAG: BatD family protein [Pseudomonadales bacterium]
MSFLRSKRVSSAPERIVWQVLSLLCVLCFSLPSAAALEASVDRHTLAQGDILQFTLRQSPASNASPPDFSILEPLFEMGALSRGSETNIVNGDIRSTRSWRLQLRPKREGTLLIPSFEVAGERSEPIALEVSAPRVQAADDGRLQLQLEASRERVVVGEPFVVTLRMLYAQDVSNLEREPLHIAGAKVEAQEPKQYQTVVDGVRYGVYEMGYTVLAEAAGRLSVTPQQISVGTGRRSIFGAANNRVTLNSNALQITVTELPPQAQGLTVASALTFSERWSSEASTLLLGESLTRTIELEVEGARAADLPTLKMSEIPHLSIYPEPVSQSEISDHRGVVYQRSRSFALVPQQVGIFEVPAYKIRWWNTRSGQIEETELPARRFEVVADPSNAASAPIDPASEALLNVPVAGSEEEDVYSNWALAAVSAYALLVSLALGYTLWRLYVQRTEPEQPLASPVDELSEKAAFDALKQAAGMGDGAFYTALGVWANRCVDAGLIAKPGIAGITVYASDKLAAMLRQLEQQLYSADVEAVVDTGRCLEELAQLRKHLRKAQVGKRSSASLAKSLYPKAGGAMNTSKTP